jgi:peptide methionine sulfoxide reductase msrA/msrB
MLQIVFAAGCFWGVEKYFRKIDGVTNVVSGYAGGNYDNPSYEDILENRHSTNPNNINHTEAIKITYDENQISTTNLIKNFWEMHDPTQLNKQGNDIGNNYRSAIYCTTQEQKDIALETMREFQILLTKSNYGKIVTEIEILNKFWPAEEYHQNYLAKNANGYCPNHSTGIKFSKDKEDSNDTIITPLGGMEILVLITDKEDKNSNSNYLELEKNVISKYKGDIKIRTALFENIKGFELKISNDNTLNTPSIHFIKDSIELWAHSGYIDPKDFFKALGQFKLGVNSEAFAVAFNDATDNRFCKQYDIFKNTGDGVFVDKLSGRPLFETKYRFNSHSGWLSFTQSVDNEVYEKVDNSHGMTRVEVRSKLSDIHLGHVFNDGPDGLPRYCINATVLDFIPS